MIRKPIPEWFVVPAQPVRCDRPPAGRGWVHEIKHDGFRIMARRDGTGVRLITRHGNDFTTRFPLAVGAVAALPAHSFVIDGEAIVTISAYQEVGTSSRPWHPSRRLI